MNRQRNFIVEDLQLELESVSRLIHKLKINPVSTDRLYINKLNELTLQREKLRHQLQGIQEFQIDRAW